MSVVSNALPRHQNEAECLPFHPAASPASSATLRDTTVWHAFGSNLLAEGHRWRCSFLRAHCRI
ncbi:hypothetical protein Bpfe_012043, partial [Biomphalaria pfeifferi]